MLHTLTSWIMEGTWWVILQLRLWKHKENPEWISEKWGIASLERPDGDLVWIHGASIGESRSALGLINTLLTLNPKRHILLTTVTKDAATLFKNNLPKRVLHQMLPVDAPRIVRRFLDHWKPTHVCFMESDFWPFLLTELRRQNIKTILLNGRISTKSFNRWQNVPYMGKNLLSGFDICLTPSQEQIDRLKALGAKNVHLSKNLKLTLPPLKIDKPLLGELKKACQNRKQWMASNTHPGEEEIILETHVSLLKRFPDLLLFLCPRHIQRAQELEALLKAARLTYEKFSVWKEKPETSFEKVQVILGDTLGNMGELYACNQVVVMGGSFVPEVGGHNLLEPAQQGCCIVHGPFMELNLEIAQTFHEANAAVQIAPEALGQVLKGLLEHPQTQQTYQKRAKALTADAPTILEEVVQLAWH